MTTFADLDDIWNIGSTPDSSYNPHVVELCKNAKPSDFYVCVESPEDWGYDDGEGCFICLAPVAYFEKTGYMFDQTLPIDHILPEDFYESMESIYESERSTKEVRDQLLSMGFQESTEFSVICNESHE